MEQSKQPSLVYRTISIIFYLAIQTFRSFLRPPRTPDKRPKKAELTEA